MPLLEPLSQFYKRCYIPRRLPGDRHAETKTAYRVAINTLDRFAIVSIGHTARLADVGDELVAGAMADLVSRGRSAATANRLMRHVKAIWAFARDHCDLPLPPCRLRPLREERREPEAWWPEEIARIVKAATQQSGQVGDAPAKLFWPAMILVQLSTGLRIRAQLAIPIDHYDRQRYEILAPAALQKQRRDQRLELLPGAAAALEALAPWDRGQTRLFGDWPYDKLGKPNTLRRHLKRILVDAGLYDSIGDVPPYKHGFHKFRRSFATQVAAAGGKDTARELLGHSTMAVTERYLDLRQLPRPRVADLLVDPVAPTEPPSGASGAPGVPGAPGGAGPRLYAPLDPELDAG